MPILLASEAFYAARDTWVLWLMTLGSMGLLIVGADRAVAAAAALARALRISKVIIGATIVSLGTTTPETCVSVVAAFRGDGGLALGNAVGSIIADTAFIFGLCAAIRMLPKDRFVLSRHGWLQTGAGVLLVLVCLGLWAASGDINSVWIPRAVGVAFLVLLAGYLYLSVRWGRQHPETVVDGLIVPDEPVRGAGRIATVLVWLIVGLALVVAGSEVLIGSAREVCLRLGVPQAVLAVTLVAMGTSLPELVTAITALVKGHEDLSVGNIIGADILNVLFVTGAAATAMPLKVDPAFFWLYLPAMMVVLLAFRSFIMLPQNRFRRWHGLLLLAMYAVFVALTLKFGVAGL
jgi:cation:H+ antiporter